MDSDEPVILREDKHLLVLNKPAGLMTEEDRWGHPSAYGWVIDYLKRTQRGEVFAANVHRLDRPASGVLIFAKKRSALKNLSGQFQQRSVEKIYYAVTTLAPASSEGRLQHWLLKDPSVKKAVIFNEQRKGADKVELLYEIIARREEMYLWRIRLITGKYHQIRAQLGHAGCPIVGDQKYGSERSLQGERICLHCGNLRFTHPSENTNVDIHAPFPSFAPWSIFALDQR